jgi:hypothetical protein
MRRPKLKAVAGIAAIFLLERGVDVSGINSPVLASILWFVGAVLFSFIVWETLHEWKEEVVLKDFSFGGLRQWPGARIDVPLIGAVVTLAICLVLVGIYYKSSAQPTASPESTTRETSLFLQFSNPKTYPVEKAQKNIRLWKVMYTPSVSANAEDDNKKPLQLFSMPSRWIIFVVFERPAIFRQMIATCRPNNITCNVQSADLVHAIITIDGDITAATLEISVVQ